MASLPLLPRQKELIRKLKPYIERDEIRDLWITMSSADGLHLFGLDDRGELMRDGWGEISWADMKKFEQCGFIATKSFNKYGDPANYTVDLFTIMQAIENDFTIADPPGYGNIHIENLHASMVNIQSTLSHVSQVIGEAAGVPDDYRKELQELIETLTGELEQVPPEQAEAITDQVNVLSQQVSRDTPNKISVRATSEALRVAAQTVKEIAPNVLTTALGIIATLGKAGLL